MATAAALPSAPGGVSQGALAELAAATPQFVLQPRAFVVVRTRCYQA